MRILVTGAAGFIASHLCEKLADLGHEVFGVDNFNNYYDIALKNLNANDLAKKNIKNFKIELNDDLSEVFEKPYDYIYHLAAQPGISSDTSLEEYVINNIYATQNLLESVETGAAKALDAFMAEAKFKYDVGVGKLVHNPGLSLTEFLDMDLVKGVFKLDVFQSMKKHVARFFKHPYIQTLMEFPVLFLGALPEDTPALYSLMNYADVKLGTWYPVGGMYKIVEAMHSLAVELGVKFEFNKDVQSIKTNDGVATGIMVDDVLYEADVIISGADYHFTETKLLDHHDQAYSDAYWNNRVMAPSCLLYYVGLNKRLKNSPHHTLFFDADFERHGKEIYSDPKWPTDPLFYVSATTATDPGGAPEGHENLFFLIPVAAGLTGDTDDILDTYFQQILKRLEAKTGEQIQQSIVYKKSYSVSDFVTDYNAFKGNAYGLANTLLQTAVLKPSCRSKKISNLYYTGQLTVPGPGVPPSLISGEVVANLVSKHFSKSVQTKVHL